MIRIRVLLCTLLAGFTQSGAAMEIYKKEIAALAENLNLPATWRIQKNMAPLGKGYARTYCTIFYSRKKNQWLGMLCLSSNREFIRIMGIRDEVPEEEDWADRSQYEVGYWSVTPLAIYPMTPFILKPIKNYAAESDCYLDDGPVYRATSMCHTALYELREGVFIYSVFHVFDNVKRQKKAQISDIRNLWVTVGEKIRRTSNHRSRNQQTPQPLDFAQSPSAGADNQNGHSSD